MLRAFTLVALLHAYIAARLLPSLPPAWAFVTGMLIGANAALVPFAFAGRRSIESGARAVLTWAGLIAVGFFSTLLVLTLLRDALLVVVAVLPNRILGGDGRDEWRGVSAAVVPWVAVLLTAIGFANARRRARVRRVDVPIRGLSDGLQGFRIVQISDLHVGPTIRRGYVEAIVNAVNALRPDLVAVTGDLVDGSVRQLAPHTEPLSRLASRHGSFFVTGNHEYYSGVSAWIAELHRLGIRVLQNEHVVVVHEGAALVVAGVTDLSAHRHDRSQRSDPQRAIAGAPRGAAKVLLAHQPASAFAAAQAGFDLQLSGHTHGGQFMPWNLFVRFWNPFTAGLHRLHDLWVYVSRGTGYWGPPKRLGAPSEITELRLVRA